MDIAVYTRRVRTSVATISPYTNRLYAKSYRWGYREGSRVPVWLRSESIEG